jgi:hypothetical protein
MRNKSRKYFEGGHMPPMEAGLAKKALDWLDRYLVPVKE